jgi:hypothetical protein
LEKTLKKLFLDLAASVDMDGLSNKQKWDIITSILPLQDTPETLHKMKVWQRQQKVDRFLDDVD